MRILNVITRNQRRGAETAAVHLSCAFARRVASHVVALGAGEAAQRWDSVQELTRSRQSGGKALVVASTPALQRCIRSFRPDVILAHGGEPAVAAAMALTFGPRSALIWQRILGLPSDTLSTAWTRLPWAMLARRVDGVVALTAVSAAETRHLCSHVPVWLVPNHRPWEVFGNSDRRVERARFATALDLPQSAYLVGFVGHFVHQKDPVLFVRLAAELVARGIPAHFVMIGDGPLRRDVHHARRLHRLDNQLHMLGHRNDVAHVLASIDLLVLTSRHESMTGVAIEAQMSGCAVVAPQLDGIDQVIRQGETGAIVPERRVESLADAVEGLLDDDASLTAVSDAARSNARRLSTSRVADEYLRRFETLICRRAIRS